MDRVEQSIRRTYLHKREEDDPSNSNNIMTSTIERGRERERESKIDRRATKNAS